MNESRNVQENVIRWQIATNLQKRTSTTSDKSFVVKLRVVIRNKKKESSVNR